MTEGLARELELLLRRAQAKRAPSVAAAVALDGEIVWADAVGLAVAERDERATPDHQYRIGSITKTFTAAAVMQLRDEGALALDDPLGRHVPEAAKPDPTVRSLLTHAAGLQREPPGNVWETLAFPAGAELVARLADAEQVLPPGERWHYSNLAFALLGEVIERVSGIPYPRYVEERLLAPLDLERTSFHPRGLSATGYLVDPYSETLLQEPALDADASGGSAGSLWSTVCDLCRWASFLAEPDPAILSPETIEEMCALRTMADSERWTLGWGLGLELWREGEWLLVGHGGAMPGFLAGVFVSRKDRVAAAVLTNNGAAEEDPEKLAARMVVTALETEPPRPAEWRPGDPVPSELEGVLGRWWSEGREVVLGWRGGQLEARSAEDPPERPPSVFSQESPDRFRTVSGRERGELLEVTRDESGAVEKLRWATYALTREPHTFGRLSP
jgi:CubicO group peptidase (beta-lactamase class C family)